MLDGSRLNQLAFAVHAHAIHGRTCMTMIANGASKVACLVTQVPPTSTAALKRKQSTSVAAPSKREAVKKANAALDQGPEKPVTDRIICALAKLRALGIESPPKILVALLSGYGHVESDKFAKAFTVLSKEG